MVPRALLASLAFLSLSALGCDAGGLLLVDGKETPPTTVQGPSVTEFAAAGNVASNAKYRVVFTMGQPTPQGVAKSESHRMNGGVVGAANGP
jgi:hypothetical protein